MTVILNGNRFTQFDYPSEKEFEDDIVKPARDLFGTAAVYIDAKKKIESKTLGGTIPDGFLFDFADPTDPQFYIVEVELSQHGFFSHIFPQITKFFAFYRTASMQKVLADKLHSVIDSDKDLKADLKAHLGSAEVYKFLTDIIESSQNILLISDDTIVEIPEMFETYEEWGRTVKVLEVRKFINGNDVIFSLSPDFEALPYTDPGEVPPGADDSAVTEKYHLEKASPEVQKAYSRIKQSAAQIESRLVFNPQRYYISVVAAKNIIFIEVRKSKMRFIAMMPEAEIAAIARHHKVVSLSPSVQKFYNGPCASIEITNTDHFDEIEEVIKQLVARVKWGT